MRYALGICALLVATNAAANQLVTITTIPAPPVAGAAFDIRVTIAICTLRVGDATVNGTNIDIPVTFAPDCFDPFPPQTFDRTVGPLPAGTYTIRVLSTADNSVVASAPVVIGAEVPALDPRVLAVLALTLTLIGLARVVRR